MTIPTIQKHGGNLDPHGFTPCLLHFVEGFFAGLEEHRLWDVPRANGVFHLPSQKHRHRKLHVGLTRYAIHIPEVLHKLLHVSEIISHRIQQKNISRTQKQTYALYAYTYRFTHDINSGAWKRDHLWGCSQLFLWHHDTLEVELYLQYLRN